MVVMRIGQKRKLQSFLSVKPEYYSPKHIKIMAANNIAQIRYSLIMDKCDKNHLCLKILFACLICGSNCMQT